MTDQAIIEQNYAEAIKGLREEWLNEPGVQWFNYVVNLREQLQTTYLVIVLDNQVINGGLHQYFVNGYGQFAEETIDALIRIGAIEKAELLKKAFR